VSVAHIGKPRADDIEELLRDLLAVNREALAVDREALAELRALRADMRRRKQSPAALPMLLAALKEHFGPARFTVRSVLDVVAEDPHGALAEAVAQVVDMNASLRSRATALGTLLSRLLEIKVVAEQRQRAASIYKLVI
jgi:hypothetical protein